MLCVAAIPADSRYTLRSRASSGSGGSGGGEELYQSADLFATATLAHAAVVEARYGDALKRLSNFVRTGSTEEREAPPKRAKRKKKPTSGGFG